MQGSNQKNWTWQERLVAELKHDKKKAVLLGVLAVVAAVLVLQQVTAGTPAETSAAVTPAASSPSTSPGSVGVTASAARNRALTDAARRRNEYLQTMDREIQRDLFVPNPRFFAPQKDTGQQDRPEKTPEIIEQERQEAIRMQAKALTLRSTIVGTVPTAVINDMVLRKGEWVGGFEVVQIKPRSCTVRKDDVSVVLKME